jgi:hypothetical protein
VNRFLFYSVIAFSAVALVASVVLSLREQYYMVLHIAGPLLVLPLAWLFRRTLLQNEPAAWNAAKKLLYLICWTYICFLLLLFIILVVLGVLLANNGNGSAATRTLLAGLFTGLYGVLAALLYNRIGKTKP